MARKPVVKKRDKDADFTPKELIKYENTFGEPIGDIQNDEKPRIKKIAYLGWLKCVREDPDLTWDDYLDNLDSLEQAQRDAFGDLKKDEEADEEEA